MKYPLGECQCGCGEKTKIARGTDSSRGWIKGVPIRYILGHQNRSSGVDYIIDPVTGCWLWQLSINNKGYGVRGNKYVHILEYEKVYGPVPEGLELDHKCSIRHCANPDHQEPVTHVVNTQRGARTKYTVEVVQHIRQLQADGLGSRVIARMMGIPRSTVGFIMSRRRWKNV